MNPKSELILHILNSKLTYQPIVNEMMIFFSLKLFLLDPIWWKI